MEGGPGMDYGASGLLPLGVLRQDPANDLPSVLRRVLAERREGTRNLADLEPERRTALLREVRRSILKMPLWRLQKLRSGREVPFLYRRAARAGSVELQAGVVGLLAGFAPMIEHIVRAAWVGFVVRHNPEILGTPAAQLEKFMFPDDRGGLERYREVLLPFSGGLCFCCQSAVRNEVHVDHFLPWSLYARDLGHNFVLAHPRCNQAKRDHLASAEHLERWCRRNRGEEGDRLGAEFDRARLPHDRAALQGAARSFYGIADATGTPVWQHGAELVALDPGWRAVLAA